MKRRNQSGQAIVMASLTLFAMCGMLGLGVDVGWSYYVQKTARAASDSGALAAVKQMHNNVLGTGGPWTCATSGVTCASAGLISCANATGNLLTGCQFAQQNGFSAGGNGGRQTLRIEANVGAAGCETATPPTCVPTAPGVAAFYWVHVVATQTVPQLFSAILGNTTAVVSADSTAALANVSFPASLDGLNHAGDSPSTLGPEAEDIYSFGGGSITAPVGIVSAAVQSCTTSCYGPQGNVGEMGSTPVTTPNTLLENAPSGSGLSNPTVDWTNSPTYLANGNNAFLDPYSGLGQPPLASNQATLPYIPVLNGNLTTSTTGCCGSGNYYAVNSSGKATGLPITVGNNVNFSGGNFGNFLFFGGVNFSNNANVTMGPGQYTFAGVQNPDSTYALDTSNAGSITAGTSATADAGRLFVVTNSNYGGSATMAAVVSHMATLPTVNGLTWNSSTDPGASFQFGPVYIGGSSGSQKFYGLNPDSNNVPASLQAFNTLLFWQDQKDTQIKYDSNGNVAASCNVDTGTPSGCFNGDPNNWPSTYQFACDNVNSNGCGRGQDQLVVGTSGSGTLSLNGVVYQPRGSLLDFGGGTINGGVAFIYGSMDMDSPTNVTLSVPTFGITRLQAVLVH
jgi:hypothetical protein